MESKPKNERTMRSQSNSTKDSLDESPQVASNGDGAENKKGKKITKREFEELVKDLKLSASQTEILGSRFSEKNFLEFKFGK